MRRNFIICALLTLLLSGCKLGHKYVRPDLGMPSEFSDIQYDSLCLAESRWTDVYHDSILQTLIGQALSHNKDLLASEARIREMAARKRIALAGLLPQVDGQAYAQREGLNYGGDNFKPDPEVGVKFAASWELDIWGNKRWARDESIAMWMMSLEARRSIVVSVIADVAETYFELVALDNELAMVRRTLDSRREGVRLAKLRFEGGLTSETSYQQAQVEYARTATHVPVLERNIAMKQNALAYLIGSYPHEIERSPKLRLYDQPDSVPTGLSSALLERRPDIRAAEQRLIAANAAVGQAYTNRFPRLVLTATGGIESEEFSNLLQSPMFFFQGLFTGPVFDMGRRQGAYRAAQAAYEEECYAYEKIVLMAFREVSDAIVEYNKSREIWQSVSLLCESAQTTANLAQLQYINGVIGYLDLLDAQRSYFDAQVSLINAERDRRIALTHLYRALGGGW